MMKQFFELSLESIPNLGNLVLQAVWEKELSAMEASGKDVIFIGHAGKLFRNYE